MSRTSAEDIRTQAVSPLSILAGAGAEEAAGAGADGVDWAKAAGTLTSAMAHSTSVIATDPVLLIRAMTSLSADRVKCGGRRLRRRCKPDRQSVAGAPSPQVG